MYKHTPIIVISLCSTLQALSASNTASQTITFSIDPIAEIAISGDPPALTASSAQAGTDPADVEDMSTFYAVTTNGAAEKVSVSLSAPMPSGTQLFVEVDAPNGANCLGNICLDTSCQNA